MCHTRPHLFYHFYNPFGSVNLFKNQTKRISKSSNCIHSWNGSQSTLLEPKINVSRVGLHQQRKLFNSKDVLLKSIVPSRKNWHSVSKIFFKKGVGYETCHCFCYQWKPDVLLFVGYTDTFLYSCRNYATGLYTEIARGSFVKTCSVNIHLFKRLCYSYFLWH